MNIRQKKKDKRKHGIKAPKSSLQKKIKKRKSKSTIYDVSTFIKSNDISILENLSVEMVDGIPVVTIRLKEIDPKQSGNLQIVGVKIVDGETQFLVKGLPTFHNRITKTKPVPPPGHKKGCI